MNSFTDNFLSTLRKNLNAALITAPRSYCVGLKKYILAINFTIFGLNFNEPDRLPMQWHWASRWQAKAEPVCSRLWQPIGQPGYGYISTRLRPASADV